jgi:hypothetical protein
MSRTILQIANGEPVAQHDGQLLTDGWYVHNDEEMDGPLKSEDAAKYVQYMLELSDFLLGQEEMGPRLNALMDVRSSVAACVDEMIQEAKNAGV